MNVGLYFHIENKSFADQFWEHFVNYWWGRCYFFTHVNFLRPCFCTIRYKEPLNLIKIFSYFRIMQFFAKHLDIVCSCTSRPWVFQESWTRYRPWFWNISATHTELLLLLIQFYLIVLGLNVVNPGDYVKKTFSGEKCNLVLCKQNRMKMVFMDVHLWQSITGIFYCFLI